MFILTRGGFIMTTIRLAKWGNSVGLRLPKHVLESLGLEAGSILNVTLDGQAP